MNIADWCIRNNIAVKALTKQTWWVGGKWIPEPDKFSIGFTLTGHDELETGCNTNAERIDAMRYLHNRYTLFASIEPIIDIRSSIKMISASAPYCSLYKIGLQSGVKYRVRNLRYFIQAVFSMVHPSAKVYFKDSLLQQAGIERNSLPECCVGRDYKLI